MCYTCPSGANTTDDDVKFRRRDFMFTWNIIATCSLSNYQELSCKSRIRVKIWFPR
uniref:Uncharacterized protein n=1 Tax=Anguilla anguilla TaxID=7936 RepID=A0A0E9QX75_ANGAN